MDLPGSGKDNTQLAASTFRDALRGFALIFPFPADMAVDLVRALVPPPPPPLLLLLVLK